MMKGTSGVEDYLYLAGTENTKIGIKAMYGLDKSVASIGFRIRVAHKPLGSNVVSLNNSSVKTMQKEWPMFRYTNLDKNRGSFVVRLATGPEKLSASAMIDYIKEKELGVSLSASIYELLMSNSFIVSEVLSVDVICDYLDSTWSKELGDVGIPTPSTIPNNIIKIGSNKSTIL